MKQSCPITKALKYADPSRRNGFSFFGRSLARTCCGFSLVEVTIAVGIAVFGVVSVMGLLPVALICMREAMDRVTETNLVRQFAGEALNTPFSKLDAWSEVGVRYFDEQGLPSAPSDARFSVTLEAVAPLFPVSPDIDQTASSNSSRIVRITVRKQPQVPGDPGQIESLHVANSGF